MHPRHLLYIATVVLTCGACGRDGSSLHAGGNTDTLDSVPADVALELASQTPGIGEPGSHVGGDRDHLLGLNSHILRPEEVAHVRALGIRHVRLPGILQLWENTERHRTDMRNMSTWADEAGIRILWYLHNVPEGSSTPASLRDRRAWMERMTRFAEWVAALPATEAIQLWNEPDQWVQMPFGAHERIDAAEAGALYAEQLEQAYPRIKAVAPHVLVVSAATADYGHDQRWRPFLIGMLAQDPPLDAVAMNAYGPWHRARELVLGAREVVGDRPLWVTEFGNDQDNGARFDPARHLESIVSQVEGHAAERLAERAYLYTLQTDPRPQFWQHGLFEPDGTPRAAYEWLRRRGR